MTARPVTNDDKFFATVPISMLALPGHVHTPGTGTVPDLVPLEAAKLLAPVVTNANTWTENETYCYGFSLFRHEMFWEAHEVWEAVWLATPPNSKQRRILRCLIQTANARLKWRMNRPRATKRLATEALAELSGLEYGQTGLFMGIDIAQLTSRLRQLAA